ncbi:MAG: hypothetical protein WC965_01535 [Thiohalomonadaceae bacterium]
MEWDFDTWLDELDTSLWAMLGMELGEVSQPELRDMFDAGYSPQAAVRRLYDEYYEDEEE